MHGKYDLDVWIGMTGCEFTSSSNTSLPACAIFTTSEWLLSITDTPFTANTISPTSRPDVSAGVSGSMADTTTGFEPCIRNPNSPDSRRTIIVLSVSERDLLLGLGRHYSYFNDDNSISDCDSISISVTTSSKVICLTIRWVFVNCLFCV